MSSLELIKARKDFNKAERKRGLVMSNDPEAIRLKKAVKAGLADDKADNINKKKFNINKKKTLYAFKQTNKLKNYLKNIVVTKKPPLKGRAIKKKTIKNTITGR